MIKPQMTPAEEISYVMRRAYERQMVSSAGGCLSIRDENGHMWISPTSEDKGHLTPEIIAEYSADGEQLSAYEGSMEWTNHLAIYQARPDVKAIFHTHSSGILSSAFAREAVEYRHFANEAVLLEGIAEIPFSVPASDQLCEDIVAAVKTGANVLTLDSHGTYILSSEGLLEAFMLQDMFEMAARSEVLAPTLGNELPVLTDEQIAAYKAAKDAETYPSFEPEDEGDEIKALREKLCELISRGYRNAVIDCCQASMSVRVGDDDFLINPGDKDIATLEPQDLVRVKGGSVEAGKVAPFRTATHRAVYAAQDFAGSVLINASAYAGMYCITDAQFSCAIDPELTFCIKGVEKYPFGTPVEKIAAEYNPGKLVAIVENDCVISTAVNGVKVLGIAECLEYATRAVSDMAARGRRPVQIAEYSK